MAEAIEKNENFIKNAHDLRVAKHQKMLKTLKKIQKTTTWKNIKTNVEKYVKNCTTCAIGKHDRSRKKGLHQFLQTPNRPFQKPALDFVIGLPESKNPTTKACYDMICTIMNGLTKYVKFVPCKTIMTTKQLTKLFLKKIFADHCIPEQIINDKNKLFISKFNIGLRQTLKLKKKHVNSIPPANKWSNGKNEPNHGTIF